MSQQSPNLPSASLVLVNLPNCDLTKTDERRLQAVYMQCFTRRPVVVQAQQSLQLVYQMPAVMRLLQCT